VDWQTVVFYLFNSETGYILEDSRSEVLSGELLAGWTASFAGNYRVGTQGLVWPNPASQDQLMVLIAHRLRFP